MMAIFVAVLISTFIPLGFLYLIRKMDFYGTGKFKHNIYSLAWGAVAYVLAGTIHSIIIANGLAASDHKITREVAPFTEEILKALILFYFVRRADFNYIVDGVIYGMCVGIGFAIFENYQYVFSNPELAVSLSISRVFSTNLVHGATSGLIGSVLAAIRTKRSLQKIISTAGILALAIGIHMGFNILVIDGIRLIAAISLGFVSTGSMIVIIRRSLKIQQQWIAEKLGLTDGVTFNEAVVVNRFQSLGDVLIPIAQHFGSERATQAESLLRRQVEIGIKRKLLSDMQDEKLRAGIEMEIEHLVAEMDSIRKSIGLYCMLFVRTVYLDGRSKLWKVINQRVTAASAGLTGGGLWAALEERVQAAKTRDRN